jgi:hypothetical protein
MKEHKELILKSEDNIIEYKKVDNTINSINKIKNQPITKLSIYQKVMQLDEFKKPEPKELVLDEEDYLSHLEEIIQRDYYPSLYKNKEVNINILKKQISNTNAGNTENIINNGDTNIIPNTNIDKINQEYIKSSNNNKNKKIDIDKYNIDSYLLNHTSEDIESLKEIFHKDKMKWLNKKLWMYENQEKYNNKIKALKEYTEKFNALPSIDKHFENSHLITAEIDARNSLFFHPSESNTNNRREILPLQLKSEEDSFLNEHSINIFKDKEVLKENTRLPDRFVDQMEEKINIKMKKQLFEQIQNSDVVKLLKEVL